MNGFEEDPKLEELARQVIRARREVAHVQPDRVLFLRDRVHRPKAFARCYSFGDHPIGFFTDRPFAIVVYNRLADHLTPPQLALLLFHELLHIPPRGAKLVDHNIKDFQTVLGLGGLDWTQPGANVPDILRGE